MSNKIWTFQNNFCNRSFWAPCSWADILRTKTGKLSTVTCKESQPLCSGWCLDVVTCKVWCEGLRVRTWAKARVRMSHRVEQARAGARQSCVTVVLCIPGPVSIPATFTACQGYFATWQSLSPTLMPTSPSHDCTGIYWIANNVLICSANVDPRDIFWNIWPALWCMGIRYKGILYLYPDWLSWAGSLSQICWSCHNSAKHYQHRTEGYPASL